MQFGIVAGRSWELLEGLDQGQTQVDDAPDGDMVVGIEPAMLQLLSPLLPIMHSRPGIMISGSHFATVWVQVWAHPLDMHYSCKGLAGWPKLHFQVWSQDVHGRNDICKCAFLHAARVASYVSTLAHVSMQHMQHIPCIALHPRWLRLLSHSHSARHVRVGLCHLVARGERCAVPA